MNFTTTCPHCGHKITAYTLPMNEGLARSFLQFAEARIRLGRAVAKGELKLDNVQYTMFQKLRHFGLIYQPGVEGRAWDLTPLGLAWYLGNATVLTPAAWMGGSTLGPYHAAWATHKEPRKPITLRAVLPTGWKPREDYVAEKAAP